MKPVKNNESSWKSVKDDNIKMIWKCEKCNGISEVSPNFYHDSGIPCCRKCWYRLTYIETKIKV